MNAIKESALGGFLPTWLVPSARMRVTLTYWWQHRRRPCLRTPTRFTELVQLRKLGNRDDRIAGLSDKFLVKAHVARVLGDTWVTPTLWHGETLPAVPPGPLPLVVKARHGCKQNAFVRTTDEWAIARRRGRRWVRRRYGRWLDEWAYASIPRGILVEPMIGDGAGLPLDYKFFVVGGRVRAIEVHVERERAHRWLIVDRDWRSLSSQGGETPPIPICLAAMIAGAEKLACGHDCVRVDLYAIDGRPVFGEMTFFPGSGLLPIEAPGLDVALGSAWLSAKEQDERRRLPDADGRRAA